MKKKSNPAIISVIAAVILASVALVFLGTGGGIEYLCDDSLLTVHTKLWKGCTVAYEDIEDIEIRDNLDIGKRINGYGSAKLNLGTFRNAEFGDYRLYAYTNCDSYAVLHLKDKSVLVTGSGENMSSDELFEAINEKIK